MISIDAHQHFWKYDKLRHNWISDEMAVIRRDFLPEHLSGILQENEIEGCIAVQADQSAEETRFLLELSDTNDFIKGVVGWVDLQAPDIEEQLSSYSPFKKLKGFRHILQGETQRDLCLKDSFLNGIARLEQFGFTYDILIHEDQLQYIPEFVSRFPDQRFVLDHMAKPDIKSGEIHHWRKAIELVAVHENVSCKISGMVTEADLKTWKQGDFLPYLDVVVNAFGMKRIMYGSDWPVCLAAGNYNAIMQIVRSYFASFSASEQQLFFADNAKDFYRLDTTR
ncbi:amidohydrolase family protein [Pedobacter cryoconitis]|uniref:L-fuconolactonase n=1 Tax=Pedobacter cryoconitis TaxID=188932 RepID=A0A7X0J409_9SPHI|nr:amidohydrolase family protein [Pedobacter cryoconitis]MBB6500736.1 L-fuconolactonase [Pedobacter cryoconitis]